MFLRTLSLRLKLVAALLLPLAVVAGYLVLRINDAVADRQVAVAQLEEVEKFEAVSRFAGAVGAEGAVLTDFTTTTEDTLERRAATDAAWEQLAEPSLGLTADTLTRLTEVRVVIEDARATVGEDPIAARTTMQTLLAGDGDTGAFGTAFVAIGGAYPDVLSAFDFDIEAISDVEEAQLLVDFAAVQRARANLSNESSAIIGVGGLPAESMNFGAVNFMNQAVARVTESNGAVLEFGTPTTAAVFAEFLESQVWADYDAIRTTAGQFLPNVAPEGVGSISTTVAAQNVDDSMQVIVDYVSAQIEARADATATAANQQLLRSVAIGLGLLLLVSLIVFMLYRAIRRPLLDVTEQSQRISEVELPQVVQAMRAGEIDSVPEIVEIEAFTNDEIGDLVSAFNGMHRTAVELAAEQAGSRRVVADMFVNLGRRNQKLLNRMLKGLGQLEQSEQDPDKLGALYKVDHLATRMRRNAESLLILAGASQSRSWSKPVPVYDVVQAALSEVENFDRVDVDASDGEMINGDFIADLAHMIAELTENALAFSPPTTRVEVIGRAAREGYLVLISDVGVGMSDESLATANQTIAAAASEDETPSEFLGLYVVGRLAARRGIKVSLREGVTGGVVARIALPSAALLQAGSAPAADQPAPVELDLEAPSSASSAQAPAQSSAPIYDHEAYPEFDDAAVEAELQSIASMGNDAPALQVPAADPSAPLVAPIEVGNEMPATASPTEAPAPLPQRNGAADNAASDASALAFPTEQVRRTPGANLPATSIRSAAAPEDLGNPDEVRSSLAGFQTGTTRADEDDA